MVVSPLTEIDAELVDRAKKQIRARMKTIRSGHPMAALRQRSLAIEARLLKRPELIEARSVALFWPILERGEVDLRGLDAQLRARGASVFYPFMDPQPEGGFVTGFRRTEAMEDLADHGRGFLEPRADAEVAHPGDVDLVIVPALAADARGHRIGYGAGYYDATLADVCPPARAIIVVYQFQMLAELPTQSHDVACDVVVTDENEYLR